MAVILLEAGLARLQASFSRERIPDSHLLEQAEQSAKRQKLKVRSRYYFIVDLLLNLLMMLMNICLQIWENFVEGEEVTNGSSAERKQKEELKVLIICVLNYPSSQLIISHIDPIDNYSQVTVTEVMGGGEFYVQLVGDQKVNSIQQQLASLSVQEAPVIGAFNPKKGDIVLAQFSADNSWNRAMVRVLT